jgi:molecular chaperone GrpE
MGEAPEPEATKPPVEPTAEPSPAEPRAPPEETPPVEDWASRFKYLLADFENYRRRAARESEQARQAGRQKVLRNLLPLLEMFDRARVAATHLPAKDPLRSGLELLAKEWDQFLRTENVEPVARVGEPFRTEEHEAVAEVDPTSKLKEGVIAEVIQQGYRNETGLLRPAKVAVARPPAKEPAPPAPVAPNEATD